jgi:antitoxin CcdA
MHLREHSFGAKSSLEGGLPMPRFATALGTRRATSVTLPVELLAEARALGLNVSKACECGLKAEIARSRAAQWLEENRAALSSSNDYVERNGLPLSEFRQF